MSEQTATWMRGDVVEFDLDQEGIAYQRCGLVVGFEEPDGPLHSSLVQVQTPEGTVHVLPPASLRKAAVSGMTAPGLDRLLAEFRERRDLLKSYRNQTFPSGTPVQVDCKRYTGPGKVVDDPDCPPDCLPVRVPNGNVWWYPLEACRPSHPPVEPPGSLEQALKKFGKPPDWQVTRPVISIDRQTGMMGVFDEFELIWGFRPFTDETAAVALATTWLKSFCAVEPEVRYPSIRKLNLR